MRVVSVNVGEPRPVTYRGKTVQTGIWKHSVDGRIAIVGHGGPHDGRVGDDLLAGQADFVQPVEGLVHGLEGR